jgi:hypothetical protein
MFDRVGDLLQFVLCFVYVHRVTVCRAFVIVSLALLCLVRLFVFNCRAQPVTEGMHYREVYTQSLLY